MAECIYRSLSTGLCDSFDPEDENPILPEGCSEDGNCNVECDPYPGDTCSGFSGGWNNCERCGEVLNDNGECYDCDGATDDICDECGAELGFCEPDCPTREDDYED